MDCRFVGIHPLGAFRTGPRSSFLRALRVLRGYELSFLGCNIRERNTRMRRHQQLQDLSREHHGALQLALHAKRATLSGDATRIAASAAACVNAFAAELNPHFVIEETTLLPELVQKGEHDLVQRTLAEHDEMRRLIAQLQSPDASTLQRFAELLSAHVRFEERELFEVAQRYLEAPSRLS